MAHRGCGFTPPTLPCHGEPMLISEILSQPVGSQSTDLNGKTVRVVGRIKEYDPNSQVLLLTEPLPPLSAKSTSARDQGSSLAKRPKQDDGLVVDTRLTDDLDCRHGSQVMFIGELEKWSESRLAGISDQVSRGLLGIQIDGQNGSSQECADLVLKAVISKCVDRLDYSLYLRCIPIWRGDVG